MSNTHPKIRALHITPWFPSDDNPVDGVFIARHIHALASKVEQHVLHLGLKIHEGRRVTVRNPGLTSIRRNIRIASWRWYEWRWHRCLRKELKKLSASKNFTHVVFHIAYPGLTYFEALRDLLPAKILIVEHWSAYHFNFHSTQRPHRLASLFHHHIPLAVVSHQLGQDIGHFAGLPLAFEILPNIVDDDTFYYQETAYGGYYLMHAYWKSPKRPMEILEYMRRSVENGKSFKLRIGGSGPLLKDMVEFVKQHALNENVEFIGQLSRTELAKQIRGATAFILPTAYETFSVVTAEAICCGCPVIADNTGALHELVNSSNGILRNQNESWDSAFGRFNAMQFDRANIAESMIGKLDSTSVGEKFYQILNGL